MTLLHWIAAMVYLEVCALHEVLSSEATKYTMT